MCQPSTNNQFGFGRPTIATLASTTIGTVACGCGVFGSEILQLIPAESNQLQNFFDKHAASTGQNTYGARGQNSNVGLPDKTKLVP